MGKGEDLDVFYRAYLIALPVMGHNRAYADMIQSVCAYLVFKWIMENQKS